MCLWDVYCRRLSRRKLHDCPQDGGVFYPERGQANTRTRTNTPRNGSHLLQKSRQSPLSRAFEHHILDRRADPLVSSPSHARAFKDSIKKRISHRIRHHNVVSVQATALYCSHMTVGLVVIRLWASPSFFSAPSQSSQLQSAWWWPRTKLRNAYSE